jgi:hypothetical protein
MALPSPPRAFSNLREVGGSYCRKVGAIMTFQPHSAALVTASAAVPAVFTAELDKAADLAREEKAPSTRRAYRSDFELFAAHGAPRVN